MIEIPNPCHEDWAQMPPTAQGRFCQACKTEVVDFSRFSDAELKEFLAKPKGNTCGRFRQDQLDRPLLSSPAQSRPQAIWWLGTLLFLAACEEYQAIPKPPQAQARKASKKSIPPEISEPVLKTVQIKGVILNKETNLPVAGARIARGIVPVMTAKEVVARTNAAGEFEFTTQLEEAPHVFLSCDVLGYKPYTHEINWEQITARQTLLLTREDPMMFVTGFVRNGKH